MDRRVFLTGLAGVGLSSLGAGLTEQTGHCAAPLRGKTDCAPDPSRGGAKVCTVSLAPPPKLITTPHNLTSPAWSWAVCMQMVFGFYGHPFSLVNLVKASYAGGKLPKTPWTELNALSSMLVDDRGQHFGTVVEKLPVRASDAADYLAENQPLIIGAFGHPVLLTAMSYTGDRLGGMTLVEAQTLDPLPGKGGKRIVSSPNWINVTFIARIGVRKAVAQK